MEKEIVIICDFQEYDDENILQVITKASSLSNQCNYKVTVLCVGHKDSEQLDKFFQYGADNIVICRQNEPFDMTYFTNIISNMIKTRIPKVILVPESSNGKITASILSARFEVGLIAGCTDIQFDENNELSFLRTAFNSVTIAKNNCSNGEFIIATVKKDIFAKQMMAGQCSGMIEEVTYDDDMEKLSNSWGVLERIEKFEKKEMNNLNKVFCIGRGVKNQDTFEKICQIANKLHVGIVGTRAVVEAGYIEKERMIGQSGKMLASPIYVGFGVSGASQHMIGVKNAEIIVAINKDKNAPIFEYADYAIVDDVEAVLAELEKMAEG